MHNLFSQDFVFSISRFSAELGYKDNVHAFMGWCQPVIEYQTQISGVFESQGSCWTNGSMYLMWKMMRFYDQLHC